MKLTFSVHMSSSSSSNEFLTKWLVENNLKLLIKKFKIHKITIDIIIKNSNNNDGIDYLRKLCVTKFDLSPKYHLAYTYF